MLAAAIVAPCENIRALLHTSLEACIHASRLMMEVCDYASAKDFASAQAKRTFDLVLIYVASGEEEGMALARQVRQRDKNALLVLVSPDAAWAVESYRVRAHDYLLLPFTQAQFLEVFNLCAQTLRRRSPFIEVKEGRLWVRIILEDILYTDYSNHYIQLHLKDRIVRTYLPFSTFAEQLSVHPRFLCCYRNMMVNMDHIVSVEDMDFLLVDGSRVPLARSERQLLHQHYLDYQFDKLRNEH